MIITFDELCSNLGINTPPSAQDLDKLVHWCDNTISTDCYFTGSLQERFALYQNLASDFLERITPNIQVNHLTAPVPAFKGETSLQFIVNKGLDVYLKTLHPTPKQLNTKIEGMSTLLYLASIRGNLHTIEALLSLGANPSEQSNPTEPLLFSALILPINHDKNMIRKKQAIYLLLSQHSKNLLNERNESGDTLLHIMSVNGYDQLIESLLSQNQTKKLAITPNNSKHYPIHSALLNGQYQCAKLLIRSDGVAQLTDAKERNALHYAALYGDGKMVKICLKYCQKDSLDEQKQTPLILAIIANNSEAINALLDCEADINATDNENRSALHYAVESNNVSVVKQLIEKGKLDVAVSDKDCKTPLDLIKESTSEGKQIRELLMGNGFRSRPSQ